MQKPYMGVALGFEAVAALEINEKVLPLAAEAVGDIEPQAFDAGVVDAPAGRERGLVGGNGHESEGHLRAPYVRSATESAVAFHPLGDADVLSAVVTPNATWPAKS